MHRYWNNKGLVLFNVSQIKVKMESLVNYESDEDTDNPSTSAEYMVIKL